MDVRCVGSGRWSAVLVLAWVQASCTVTALPPTEADRNREKVVELEREVARLERRTADLESALAAARLQAPTRIDGTPVPSEVLAEAPFAIALRIGRFSGVVADGSTGRMLRLYLQPLDARDDVVQVAGSAVVEVLWIDEAGGSHPVAREAFDPAAWRERFRSGFMGRHYTVEVPLGEVPREVVDGAPQGRGSLLARVRLTDGLTGRELLAESLFQVQEVSSAP